MSQWERYGGIKVGEDTDEDDGDNHVELVLGEDAVWAFVRLERQGEHVCCEMDGREIADAAIDGSAIIV